MIEKIFDKISNLWRVDVFSRKWKMIGRIKLAIFKILFNEFK